MSFKITILVLVVTFGYFKGNNSTQLITCECNCPELMFEIDVTTEEVTVVADVTMDQCTCENIILPKAGKEIKGVEAEYCRRCHCKGETRIDFMSSYVCSLGILLGTSVVAFLILYFNVNRSVYKRRIIMFFQRLLAVPERLRRRFGGVENPVDEI